MSSMKRLAKEYKQFLKEPSQYYSIEEPENMLEWDVILFGPPDTLYENGVFPVKIKFPKSYPMEPPVVTVQNIIHPNIYTDGKVCISILHSGRDTYGYEQDSERWSPSHNVNSILLSIISMLSDPNFESPANIDASVLWKNNPETYKKKVYELIK